ncbi:hypothetical protein Ancab_001395 [Ancistrocladus abbreviatus]
MPLEPFPWDRKDFFRERKHSNHERPTSDSLGPVARWRDSSSSSSHGSRNEFVRWGFFPEFRRPPGHAKQGGWDLYHEVPVHGFPIPRSAERLMEDDGFRPFGPRADARYARNYREYRASFYQKDWKGRGGEYNHHHNATSNAAVRQHELNDQMSGDDVVMRASHPDSDTLNASDQQHDKDQVNKSSDVNGLGTSQRIDKENSLAIDWKPLKWSRSGSLTSRGSGFSHSSSSRSIGVESSDTRSELLPQNAAAVESPSRDPFACATSAASLEETASRKKPRLGWGEGLAKYEKKKVEVPDENATKNGNTLCASIVERTHSLPSNLAERSPRIGGFSDCASPATPSSVGCSSSPGMEDKSFGKAMDIDLDSSNNISLSPSLGSQIQLEGSSLNLEDLEHSWITNLSALVSELLQSEDQSMVDSCFIKSSALNKLLLWKKDITKVLELTESEVDSLESELKSLMSEFVRESPCPASSSSLPVDCKEQSHKELSVIPRPPPLDVLSSGDIVAEDVDPCCNIIGDAHAEVREEEIESPGTATSKYVEVLSLEKPISPELQKTACSEGMVNVGSVNVEANVLATSSDVNRIVGSSDGSIQESDACGHVDGYPLTNSKNYVYDYILASNQEGAGKASELLIKLLPNCDYRINIADAIRAARSENELLVRKKFLLRKRYLRFKEIALSLKYRAFQYLWKEDLRLLSGRKHRAKLQKKLELNSRVLHTGCQKSRSSIRSRFASPAGSLSLVPTAEIVTFISKLLSDSQVKLYRNSLKMPALILDEKEKVLSRFISSNGLVEDPCAVEKERSLVNPWTAEEKMIFMDKLATFGKDFRKISSFLDHKTTADCIEFYYKNHKSECFEERKKNPELKKQVKSLPANTYLVTSGKKWSREINSVSLDLLGAASAIVARVDQGVDTTKLFSDRFCDMKSRATDGILEGSSSYDVENERETAAADVLAGICGSLSSEAMSSCITSSVDPGEGCQDWKCQKVSSSTWRPLTPEVTQKVDNDPCSDESCGEMDPVDDWTDEEKSVFVQAFSSYGKDFLMISRCVQTKSRDQCKVFFSKAWKCLGLDILCPVTAHGGTPATNDRSGSGSDSEDACVVEAGSAVSSDKSGSRMGEDLRIPISEKDHGDTNCVGMDSHDEIIGEDCGLEDKSENMPSDDHQADDASEMTLDGGIMVNDEVEKTLRVQEQENKLVSVASGGGEEQAMGQDILVAEAAVDCVSAPSSFDAVADPNVSEEVVSEKPETGLATRDVSTPDVPSSAKIFEDITRNLEGVEECNKQSASENIHQPVSRQTLMDHGESSTIPKSYPFVSIRKEVNGNVSQKLLSTVEGVFRTEMKFQSPEDCHLKKCSCVASQDLVTELNFRPESEVPPKDLGSDLPCPANNEKQCGNGDVKLFGQILSKPSSVEKPLSCVKDVKPFLNHCMKDNLISPNHDHANYLGLEKFPARSYGFWDGTRIQTGHTSLPDSATAMLLAKYTAAVSNCSLPSSKTEQQIVNTNECHLNGASVFPSRESCSSIGGLADHQACRNQDGMQPFKVEMKQRQDMLSEVQRNRLEAVSSLQQQQGKGNGFVKLNAVQVEGSYGGGISDPVAALRLYYSKAQAAASGKGTGNIVREEESWRG